MVENLSKSQVWLNLTPVRMSTLELDDHDKSKTCRKKEYTIDLKTYLLLQVQAFTFNILALFLTY